jgi:hypothetical protein
MLVLGLVLVLAQTGIGQQRRGGRGGPGGGGIGFLLTNESVQKELKLEPEQVDKIKDAVAKIREKHADDRQKLQDLQGEERRTEAQKLNQTINKETTAAVSGILKPEQTKRLKQIQLQTQGTQAFSSPEVQQALNLTTEQKEKIKTISDDTQKEMRELRGGGGGGGRANFEKIAALRKEANDKVQAVLTDEQKAKWKELTGAPFQLQMGGRRRGGQRQQ